MAKLKGSFIITFHLKSNIHHFQVKVGITANIQVNESKSIKKNSKIKKQIILHERLQW